MDAYLGEIRMFSGHFAPRKWFFCDGEILTISSHHALFSLLGTTYGGDGLSNFALPDLRARLPIHQGQGPGLTNRQIGASFGEDVVYLGYSELPNHRHDIYATTDSATKLTPDSAMLGDSTPEEFYRTQESPHRPMSWQSITHVGGSEAHANAMRYQAIHYIIASEGVYPSMA